MRTNRRLACLLLTLSLALGLVPFALAEEPMEITIATLDIDKAFRARDPIIDEIEARFNVRFVPENLSRMDYVHKTRVWAASGSLPDVASVDIRETVTYYDWVSSGLLKAIPDDLSAYPHLEAYLQDPGLGDNRIDGRLYCIPHKTYDEQAWTATDRTLIYRWDLAQAAGITKEPENWQEFREMIQAIMRADPEGKNIAGLTASDYSHLLELFCLYSVPMAYSNQWIENEAGLYVPAYFAGDPVPGMQLARDMYREGTIVPELALINIDQSKDMFLHGRAAAMLGTRCVNFYDDLGEYWEDVHGTPFFEKVRVLGLMDDVNGEKYYPVWGYAWSELIFNANISDEKFHTILSLLDYLLTDEGMFLTTFGYEGVDYTIEEGRITYLTDETGGQVNVRGKYPSTHLFSTLVRWDPATYDDRWPLDVARAPFMEQDRIMAEAAARVPLPEVDPRYQQAYLQLNTGFEMSTTLKDEDMLMVMMGTEPVADMWAEIYQGYVDRGLPEVIARVNEHVRAQEETNP